MLTVFVSDAVVTAVILNTTFIRALTSFARANTAVSYPYWIENIYEHLLLHNFHEGIFKDLC